MKQFRIGVVVFLILACLLLNGCCASPKADICTYTIKFTTIKNIPDDGSSVGSYINELTLAERRVQMYIELMKTTHYYETLRENSKVTMTAAEIGNSLTFKPLNDTGFFYVHVTASESNAKALAQAVADTTAMYLESIIENVSLTCTEEPSLLRTDQNYTDSVTFYVNNHSLDNSSVSIGSSDIVDSTSLADTCIIILNSRHVYEEIRTVSGFTFDYETYRSMLTTSTIKNTNMFEVTVTAPSEDEANTLIAAVTDILPRKIKDIAKDITLEIV